MGNIREKLRQMTSQLAKELALGIKSEVEDIGAVFKKMAFLHPQGEVKQNSNSSGWSMPYRMVRLAWGSRSTSRTRLPASDRQAAKL